MRYMFAFICYSKCTTCQKAQRWLNENGIAYQVREIKENPPTKEELSVWIPQSGLPLRRFFNTSGLKYKELGLKSRLESMSEEEQLALLASDCMLVKRPLLIGNGTVLVGFREAEWQKIL